jgi:hypothetical protein
VYVHTSLPQVDLTAWRGRRLVSAPYWAIWNQAPSLFQNDIRIFAYLPDFLQRVTTTTNPITQHHYHGVSRSPRLTPQARSTRCRTRVRPCVTRVPRCGEWDRVDLRPTLFGSCHVTLVFFLSSRILSMLVVSTCCSCVCYHPLSPSLKRRR